MVKESKPNHGDANERATESADSLKAGDYGRATAADAHCAQLGPAGGTGLTTSAALCVSTAGPPERHYGR